MSPRRLIRHPAVLTGAVLLVLLGAAAATPWQVRMPDLLYAGLDMTPPPQPTPSSPPPATLPQDDGSGDDDTTVTSILIGLAVVAVALLLALAARKILAVVRQTPPRALDPDHIDTGDDLTTTDQPTVPLPELLDAVSRALAHLDDARTPTDGVIAAWVALEDAAAEHGTRRDPAQTPTEFAHEVLDATPAPAGDLDTLRRLYQRARFTDHTVTDHDVDHARAALTAIARSLDTPATASSPRQEPTA